MSLAPPQKQAPPPRDLAALLREGGMGPQVKPKPASSPEEQRIMAGFEDIVLFYEAHGHAPRQGEEHDIFERLYAVRLESLRTSPEAVALLAESDVHGLLAGAKGTSPAEDAASAPTEQAGTPDDDALAALLAGGGETGTLEDITTLKHVPYRKELNAAEEVASQKPCEDFEQFKPLFQKVSAGLKSGSMKSWRFKEQTHISCGQVFILKGMMVYVAAILKNRQGYDGKAERLRVIYANGTESDLLSSSLERALYKDKEGRKISALHDGPLFEDKKG